MTDIFTNIQQSFNQINKNNSSQTLLEKQQSSQDMINQLLEKSSQAIMCGPACQKYKVSEELKQKYLDAETNLQIAPIKFEQSKKNYYTYSQGSSYYNNMQEEELKSKAEKISQMLEENFNNEVLNANIMNTYLNTELINSNNSIDLLNEFLEKNKTLKLTLRERHGDILTNDRKSYYEDEAFTSLKLWYSFLWYIYYIFVIILLLAIIFSPSQLTIFKKVVLFILFVFYPYYINYIWEWIVGLYKGLVNNIPKNVYNNL